MKACDFQVRRIKIAEKSAGEPPFNYFCFLNRLLPLAQTGRLAFLLGFHMHCQKELGTTLLKEEISLFFGSCFKGLGDGSIMVRPPWHPVGSEESGLGL